MKLSDLRKLTVKKNLRIRFPLSNGMECVLNEHGVAQVPALRGVPTFNLEDEFARTQEFLVEPARFADKDRGQSKSRFCTRDEMVALAMDAPAGDAGREEHED